MSLTARGPSAKPTSTTHENIACPNPVRRSNCATCNSGSSSRPDARRGAARAVLSVLAPTKCLPNPARGAPSLASPPRTPRRRSVWPLAAALLLSGCTGLDARYIAADKATYEAIAPEYQIYIERDMALTSEQRKRRVRTLEAWTARLQEAERGLGEETQNE